MRRLPRDQPVRAAGDRGRRRAAAPAGGAVSASKSYSERLFRYQRIDRLDREAADLALRAPAEDEDAAYDDDALAAMYAATGGYPYFIQAYGKAVWDLAPRSPITADDVAVAAPEAERELAVGFFGSPLRAGHAGGARLPAGDGRRRRRARRAAARRSTTSSRCRPPTSPRCSARSRSRSRPARDALLKKGLIYSGERGRIAFTVPHFGRYLREHG